MISCLVIIIRESFFKELLNILWYYEKLKTIFSKNKEKITIKCYIITKKTKE